MEDTGFQQIKEEAIKWTSKSENVFKILTCDDTERRIDFHHDSKADLCFYVVKNTPEKQFAWHVWSDNEDVLNYLNPVLEKCTSCRQLTLTSLLDSISIELKQFKKSTKDKPNDDDDEDDDEFVDCDAEGLGDQDEDENNDDDEDDDDDYYYNDDLNDDPIDSSHKSKTEDDDDEDEEVDEFFTGDASSAAVARLLKDLKNMQKIKGKYGIEGSPKGNNIFVWDVTLTDIPTDSALGKDLDKYAKKYNQKPVISLEMQFPKDYPFSPPFIRVIRPRFQFLTGHVTIGGSICMQMLTKSGWSPSNDIELILIQVRSEILSDDKARLASGKENEVYSQTEAKQAFDRMVHRYGWNK